MSEEKQKTGTAKEELNLFLGMAKNINSSLDLNIVLENALSESMRVMGAEDGALWLCDENREFIEPRVAKGPKAERLKGVKLGIGEGFAGQVVSQNEAILAKNALTDRRWTKQNDFITGYSIRSVMTVPISWKGQAIGCIQLINKIQGGTFTRGDLRLISAQANLLAIIITNAQLLSQQKKFIMSITKSLSAAIDARDPYTRGHSGRVTDYAVKIGEALGFSMQELEALEIAALLHDIGKIGVSDSILGKTGKLEEEEYDKIKEHTKIGARIIAQVEPFSLIKEAYEVALYHQERYDGSGYPEGLAGKKIPIMARIVAVADAFDAMTSNRPYRCAMRQRDALRELNICRNIEFDPQIVRVFFEIIQGSGATATVKNGTV